MISDVVVVGGGAAGLTSAIVASDKKSEVIVLEKSGLLGGSASVSAGDLWIPNNDHMKTLGAKDSEDEALRYLMSFHSELMEKEMIDCYVRNAPQVLRYLEKGSVKVEPRRFPDYHEEFDGGNVGRTVGTALFDGKVLGPWRTKVRTSKVFPPITFAEVEKWAGKFGGLARPDKIKFDVIQKRFDEDVRGGGSALVCMLLNDCIARGVKIEMNVRAESLVKDSTGRVIGVRDSSAKQYLARKAVILATGGYDWNVQFRKKFLMYPWAAPLSPPCIEGDGLKMGLEVGADLASMPHAFWAPSFAIPGEDSEGKQLHRFLEVERAQPGSIIVNRRGNRFVNESVNYHDFVKQLHHFDAVTASYPNKECWLVFDQDFREKYVVATIMPAQPMPSWIASAPSLEGLAGKLGVDAQGLVETVKKFNKYAIDGRDPEFQRGEASSDSQWADPDHKPNPSLGPLERSPFYAIPVVAALFGTEGGLRINTKGQVLDANGSPIPGLYACGNVTAHPFAPAYPASGVGIGNALIFGFLAGSSASEEKTLNL